MSTISITEQHNLGQEVAKDKIGVFEEMVQKREIAISFIKHFASEVEVGDWDSSQMPDLIMAYSSYEQIVEYLDKKFSRNASQSHSEEVDQTKYLESFVHCR